MTILVAYVARLEGEAVLDEGIEIAKRRDEHPLVVNDSPGGVKDDPSAVDAYSADRVQKMLQDSGLNAEFKQLVRGKNAVNEIVALVDAMTVSVLIIRLRKRSAVGKFIMGSVAQQLLLSVSCPVLAVKAGE